MSKIAAEKVREFRAEAKFQRTSPQKAKLVLDTIKGMRVEQALNTVHFSTKRMGPVDREGVALGDSECDLRSQEQGLDIDVDNLYVRTAVANEGPRMKRIRPAPMGRAFRYQRRLAHIIVTVAEKKSGHQRKLVVVGEVAAPVEETDKPVAKKPRQRKQRQENCSKEGCGQEVAAKKAAK
jgi:large subunit ribosomal protein L22